MGEGGGGALAFGYKPMHALTFGYTSMRLYPDVSTWACIHGITVYSRSPSLVLSTRSLVNRFMYN